MTTLEAIELVRSTPVGEVSAEQLTTLRALLEKTPSLYAVLSGRPAVESFIQKAEAAIKSASTVAVIVAPEVRSTGAATLEPQPTTPPFWASWSRRRMVEMGVFGVLLIAFGVTLVAILLSMSGGGRSPSMAKTAAAAEGSSDNSAAQDAALSAAGTDAGGGWQDWTITPAAGARIEKTRGWDLSNPALPRPTFWLQTAAGGVTFERVQIVPEGTGSIRINCLQMAASPVGSIELFVDGQSSGTAKVPAPGAAEPLLLPLAMTAGKQIALKVVYTPGAPGEQVEWRSLALSKERVEAVGPTGEPDATRPSLTLWLRADRGVKDAAGRGPVDAGFDGQVRTWEDQSQRRYHLNSEGGAAPKYTAAEPLLAGKPGLAFSGAFLRHNNQPLYETPSSTTVAVFTVQGLARKQRGSSAVIFETSAPGFGWHTGAYHDRRGRYGHDVTFVGPKPSAMTSKIVPMGTYALIAAARVNDRESYVEVNGRDRMFVEATGGTSGDTLTLGGSPASPGSYGGTIAEVLVFNRALSGVELRQVGKYLQGRYGIGGNY